MYKQVVFIGRDYKASHNWNLEKDKVYDVIHESTYNYYIKNPIGGGQFAFAKNNFITIQDYRDLKLKELVEQHPTNGRCKCILYDQTTGKCNHSPEIITVLEKVILGNSFHYNLSLKSNTINSIDRWNLYGDGEIQIHIVYTVKIHDIFKSAQVVCDIIEFANRW